MQQIYAYLKCQVLAGVSAAKTFSPQFPCIDNGDDSNNISWATGLQ